MLLGVLAAHPVLAAMPAGERLGEQNGFIGPASFKLASLVGRRTSPRSWGDAIRNSHVGTRGPVPMLPNPDFSDAKIQEINAPRCSRSNHGAEEPDAEEQVIVGTTDNLRSSGAAEQMRDRFERRR
jgi:hypothetical protein